MPAKYTPAEADEAFWTLVDKNGPTMPGMDSPCWVWTGSIVRRYGRINQHGERLAHRVAWVKAHGPVPAGMKILHRCDNPPCVRADHLWTGTQLENIADREAKGRGGGDRRRADANGSRTRPEGRDPVRGERNPNAKLTAPGVREIRRLYQTGEATIADLARSFSLHYTTVQDVVLRKTWRHVD